MGTPFTEINRKFLSRLKSYSLFELEDDEIDEELLPYLESATSRFVYYCQQDISDTDFSSGAFPVKLNLTEKEIITGYMLLSYIDMNISNLEILEQTLNSRDYRIYSEANFLKAKLDLRDKLREDVEVLLSRYSYYEKGVSSYDQRAKR